MTCFARSLTLAFVLVVSVAHAEETRCRRDGYDVVCERTRERPSIYESFQRGVQNADERIAREAAREAALEAQRAEAARSSAVVSACESARTIELEAATSQTEKAAAWTNFARCIR
jgi:hypothetical protein